MKRILFYIFGVGMALFLLNYFYLLWSRTQSYPSEQVHRVEIHRQLEVLKAETQLQLEREERLARKVDELILQQKKPDTTPRPMVHKDPRPIANSQSTRADVRVDKPIDAQANTPLVIPILIFTCNRPPNDSLNRLIEHRSDPTKFPIIVTQDCNDVAAKQTSDTIDSFGSQIFKHIKQPDQSPFPDLNKKEKKFETYFKISRHYKWALGQVFDVMNYEAVIILEDDLIISPDFFDYFEAGYHLMQSDPSLFCVSAWNDNGKTKRIEDNAERLWRSDFFPGLGWLFQKKIWDEVKSDWPLGFWDDWFRQDGQRKDRACIRPEISRVSMSPIGKKGASKGQFFDKHLKFIIGNTTPVHFTAASLHYLHKDVYDQAFVNEVYGSPLVKLSELQAKAAQGNLKAVRVQYTTKQTFKLITKTLELMDDFKEGVPRTAYRGVIPIMFDGLRVYITPPSDWKSYDKTWS